MPGGRDKSTVRTIRTFACLHTFCRKSEGALESMAWRVSSWVGGGWWVLVRLHCSREVHEVCQAAWRSSFAGSGCRLPAWSCANGERLERESCKVSIVIEPNLPDRAAAEWEEAEGIVLPCCAGGRARREVDKFSAETCGRLLPGVPSEVRAGQIFFERLPAARCLHP